MREDMNKVLCENARHGHSWHYDDVRTNRFLDAKYDDMYEDDEPGNYATGGARESMTHRHNLGWNRKSFNEHLSPLYGNIRKAVGRKWDDFFSELNETFDTRSVINRHILLHLYDRIAVDNVYVDDDGELMVRRTYGQQAESLLASGTEFYVDPRDGIIKFNKHYRSYRTHRRQDNIRWMEKQRETKRVIDKETELHKIGENWFEIKFKSFVGDTKVEWRSYSSTMKPFMTRSTVYPYTYDVLEKTTVSKAKVAVSKRTLSHKELKKHGII